MWNKKCTSQSLDLTKGIVECCQWFVNGKPQKIDVTATVTATAASVSTHSNDHSKEVTARIFLNAAEMGGLAQKLSIDQRRLGTRLRAA
jgi:hypothetical protein